MKLSTLIVAAAGTANASWLSIRTPAGILQDIGTIDNEVNELTQDINNFQTLNDAGTVLNQIQALEQAIQAGTSEAGTTDPLNGDDASSIINAIKNIIPDIYGSLNAATNKSPTFESQGVGAVVQDQLSSISSFTNQFATALIDIAPGSLLSAASAAQDCINTGFASAFVTQLATPSCTDDIVVPAATTSVTSATQTTTSSTSTTHTSVTSTSTTETSTSVNSASETSTSTSETSTSETTTGSLTSVTSKSTESSTVYYTSCPESDGSHPTTHPTDGAPYPTGGAPYPTVYPTGGKPTHSSGPKPTYPAGGNGENGGNGGNSGGSGGNGGSNGSDGGNGDNGDNGGNDEQPSGPYPAGGNGGAAHPSSSVPPVEYTGAAAGKLAGFANIAFAAVLAAMML